MTDEQRALALKVMADDNRAFRETKTVEEAETIQATLASYRQTLAEDSLDARRVDGTLRKLRLHTNMLFHVIAAVPMD